MKNKFKVGDMVINKNHEGIFVHTDKGFIGEVTKVWSETGDITVKGKSVWPFSNALVGEWTVDSIYFDLYTPHEGKILIMVDEKDNSKIIARDLLTNKTAEAKCSPKDEWDFHKGAKLALERLTEPEKPKSWTGKVVCVCNNVGCGEYLSFHNYDFIVGKVYTVKDGYIISEQHRAYTGIELITSPEQLSWTDKSTVYTCPYRCKFIEYKGGAEE